MASWTYEKWLQVTLKHSIRPYFSSGIYHKFKTHTCTQKSTILSSLIDSYNTGFVIFLNNWKKWIVYYIIVVRNHGTAYEQKIQTLNLNSYFKILFFIWIEKYPHIVMIYFSLFKKYHYPITERVKGLIAITTQWIQFCPDCSL